MLLFGRLTDRYRKSFPGASSSFTSGYFCDVSTDTEGSVHSPNLRLSSQTLRNPARREGVFAASPELAHQSLSQPDQLHSSKFHRPSGGVDVAPHHHRTLEPTSETKSQQHHRLQQSPCQLDCTESHTHCQQPHYQFRKSNSMKLALNEDEEGDWKPSFLSTSFYFCVFSVLFHIYILN